jgi:hypothetical protein
MPAQQSKFILDLSSQHVALWLRVGGDLKRLTEVSVNDNQIIQKLRANRIAAEIEGSPTVDIYLPSREIKTEFLSISEDMQDAEAQLTSMLYAKLDLVQSDVSIFIAKEKLDGTLGGAAVSNVVLAQSSDFARGAGFEPAQFSCPDLTYTLGVIPKFSAYIPYKKRKKLPVLLATAATLALVTLAGGFWYGMDISENASFASTTAPDIKVEVARSDVIDETPASKLAVASNPEGNDPTEDYKVWFASTDGTSVVIDPVEVEPEVETLSETVTKSEMVAIARTSVDYSLVPNLLDRYVPHAAYRVAQALSGTVSDQTKTLTMSPNLRPFTLGSDESQVLAEIKPKLRPSVFAPITEPNIEQSNENIETADTQETAPVEEQVATIEPLQESTVEDQTPAEVSVQDAPNVLTTAPELAAVETPSVEVEIAQESIVAEIKEDAPEIIALVPEDVSELTTSIRPPKVRPSDYADKIAAQLKAANAPKQHSAHIGFNPGLRPASIRQQVLASIAAQEQATALKKAEDQKRIDELLAARAADEAERLKQREQEILQKAQEQTVIASIQNQQASAKPYAYPALKPNNFARKVSRIKSVVKANTAGLDPNTDVASTGQSGVRANTQTNSSTKERVGVFKNSISLIGVFGTPQSRRALIRLRGGGYKTVKMGQSVGGWRVSAIGASSVRMKKGSRAQVLRMP